MAHILGLDAGDNDNTVDLADYLDYEDTVDRSQLRAASSFSEQLQAVFAPPAGVRSPQMFSTKLRGGIEFRRGELTVWCGYNGHRKSMYTSQLILDLIAQKQRVLLASFEMLPAQSLARMARQAWASAVPTRQQLLDFGSWTDGKLWLFDHFGRISPSKLLAMCRYFEAKKIGHHVVIDSMMMACKSEEHLDEQKQFVTDLVRLAQELGLHIHLIAHCRKPQHGGEDKPPTKYDLRGSASISDQAHNVVTIWANKSKKAKLEEGDTTVTSEPDALVAVEKQRNGQWEGRCKLWFDERTLRFCDDSSSAVEPYAALAEL